MRHSQHTAAIVAALFLGSAVAARAASPSPKKSTDSAPKSAAPVPASQKSTLLLEDVLSSIRSLYPPYLAALLEQDIANGRVRSALGAFDLQLASGGALTPMGYYDGRTGYASLDQPLPFWGGNVYGGYRISSGFLPNYNKDRTGIDGEGVLGFRIPLLRDGTVDRRRATLWQARIDQDLADPLILRQYLDFVRAGSVSYFNWVASGQRLDLSEDLLRIAKDRDSAISEQVKSGASAPIVQIDNQRLVVSREISVVQALRRFQAASIELSLFLRAPETAAPILAGRERLPKSFPAHPRPDPEQLNPDLARARVRRPEVRRIALSLEKASIDKRLAQNNLLPNIDVGVEASQSLGSGVPKDIEPTEVTAKLEFKLPLQRREAKGRLDTVNAQISRLLQEQSFALDRIGADVQDSMSALVAAFDALGQSRRNVQLAQTLQEAENERFRQGAADLLALQIREQATFDAKVLEVEALADYFRAQANYRAATAADSPNPPPPAAAAAKPQEKAAQKPGSAPATKPGSKPPK
jgi:outer membrane protein TolC